MREYEGAPEGAWYGVYVSYRRPLLLDWCDLTDTSDCVPRWPQGNVVSLHIGQMVAGCERLEDRIFEGFKVSNFF